MRAFTIVEVLIVLSLLAIVAGFALIVSFDAYRGDSLRVERATLVAALEHARAQSVGDICLGETCAHGEPHGVSIQKSRYVLFQGASYEDFAVEEEPIDANAAIAHAGASEIVFQPFSGDVEDPGSIVLSDSTGKTATITVEAQGQILWSD